MGKAGGAYDSDYLVAIEDAIVLKCDTVNLSLGSSNPGATRHTKAEYQAILDRLTESGIVVAIAPVTLAPGWSLPETPGISTPMM